jgi:hypothetical protein
MIRYRVYMLYPFLCFLAASLHAQYEANVWYFGSHAGLSFSGTLTSVLNNNPMSTSEGCSSICGTSGNLLFYTSGDTVYNQQHQVMDNGAGLLGDNSTTQAALIVRQPSSPGYYYIFTLDDYGGPDGMRYNIANMNLSAGMGSVTVKNTLLYSNATEGMAAVMHCNQQDVWILSHGTNFSTTFRANLLTAAGLSLTPVTSTAGPAVGFGAENIGQMKVSPTGKRLALAKNTGEFELYDFDPSTGVVSNPLILNVGGDPYGCEFSPDGSKFYGASLSTGLFQWDLCAGTSPAILSSQYTITGNAGNFGSLQTGPNGKLYVARLMDAFLDVINDPNSPGAACAYSPAGQPLGNGVSLLGLPSFVSSGFRIKPQTFSVGVNCNEGFFLSPYGATGTTLCLASGFNSLSWSFGDPASGSLNSSTLSVVQHVFSAPGAYNVRLAANGTCFSDTLYNLITAGSAGPPLTVKGPFTVCEGSTATYTVSGAGSYFWSNGTSGSTVALVLNQTAVYQVVAASGSACAVTKSFTVNVNPCTGVENDDAMNVRMFPNPVHETLFVYAEQDEVLIEILDQTGRKLYSEKSRSGRYEIELSQYLPGYYFLCLYGPGLSRVKGFAKQ